MKTMFDLHGKVAVITGATGMLGKNMAKALTEQGCDLVLASRSKEKAEVLSAELSGAYGVRTLPFVWDAQDRASIDRLAKESHAWQGHVDILINNAGGNRTTSAADLLERSDEDIEYVIKVNLLSPLFCCRAFLRIMKEQKNGSVINIGSIAGVVGRDRRLYKETGSNEQLVDYVAAKGGVISMTRDLAAKMAPYGIRVNTISPGGFSHGTSQKFQQLYGERTPAGFMGRADKDIGGAAVFLASDEGAYVNGHNLLVDGGFSIWK
ncbi:MAG: SDR family oxidoreductase [Clostridia bacterium]